MAYQRTEKSELLKRLKDESRRFIQVIYGQRQGYPVVLLGSSRLMLQQGLAESLAGVFANGCSGFVLRKTVKWLSFLVSIA
jgi:predicted AAA+ superfamily ATPase